jgi:hypothetical protein
MKKTLQKTLKSHNEGQAVDEIAETRDLKPSTIEGHLAELVKMGAIPADDLSDIVSEKEAYFIEKAYRQTDGKQLSEVKDELEPNLTYGKIKLGLAMQGITRDEDDSRDRSSTIESNSSTDNRYRLLWGFDKTCGDYGGVNRKGWPCGSFAGSRTNRDEGRCQYHTDQDPQSRSGIKNFRLKILRLIQLQGLAVLLGSSNSDDVSVYNTIFSTTVIVLIVLGIVLSIVPL